MRFSLIERNGTIEWCLSNRIVSTLYVYLFPFKLFMQYKNDRRFGWIEHSMFVWNMRERGWNKCFPSRNIGHSWSIHCDLCWWLGSWCGWWVTSEFDGVYAIGAMVWRVRRSSPRSCVVGLLCAALHLHHEAAGGNWTKRFGIFPPGSTERRRNTFTKFWQSVLRKIGN